MPPKGKKLAQTDLEAIESKPGLRIEVSAAGQRLSTDTPSLNLNRPVPARPSPHRATKRRNGETTKRRNGETAKRQDFIALTSLTILVRQRNSPRRKPGAIPTSNDLQVVASRTNLARQHPERGRAERQLRPVGALRVTHRDHITKIGGSHLPPSESLCVLLRQRADSRSMTFTCPP
jgi:hypothetical protein